ncbi:unnamed protein product (macronuclear) [Paramecium tetraurelia]|uniref:Uncharacterized protein n=1 Tax=Paramecium tetraurelia TaxID=5888 RepID=A0DA91_PARTE|nr:uncharacterized protein GSPATT00014865001 [Paramecium tetraurelia]CAK79958.1 unnamed protein product [Paramecium tetraurelia]|eukprot:XP_001447355.1 hypothetical protein (macronuclear) [Paramecium tetraurelia strain d4-2]
MLQRKIIVPSRRKPQTESQPIDDFYFESSIETVDVDEITSLLAKRLKFENGEDTSNESLKTKKCCFSDEKFVTCKQGLEILSKQSQISLIPKEKHCAKYINQLISGEKRIIQLKNIAEFKKITTGEINYMEFYAYPDVTNPRKLKKKRRNTQITKKIHKL